MAAMINRRRYGVVVLLLLAVSLPVGACGGGGGPVTLDDFGSRFDDAICDVLVACHDEPDKASCLATWPFQFGQVVADVKAGKVKFNADAAAACIDGVRAESCSISLSKGIQACQDAFQGLVADGGACFTDVDCVSERCALTTSCMGTCSPAPTVVPVGGDCSQGTNHVCDAASYCKAGMAPGSGTCTATSAVGAACTYSFECAARAFCNLGTCVTTLPIEGQACDPNSFISCDRGDLSCQPAMPGAATGTCTPRGTVGAACADDSACLSYEFCNSDTMTCALLPGLGQSCATSFFCQGDLECDATNVCVAPTPEMICM